MRHNRKLFLVVLFIFLGGCTHHYVPRASTFKLDSIDEFNSSSRIALVNAQLSTEDVLFARSGGYKYYANLSKWTDTAIEISRRELTKRGMSIDKASPKVLELSIEEAVGTFGFAVLRGEVKLKVKTSDGYSKTYKGDNRSPMGTLYRAVDGAVMRAVAEMLRDKKIVKFLK